MAEHPGTIDVSAAGAIRQAVAAAERRRRHAAAVRWISRALPATSTLWIALAALGRWGGMSISSFTILVIVTIIGLVAYACWLARLPVVTDAIAARVDRDAQLSGELRSAHWFSTTKADEELTQFHLSKA